MNYQEKPLAAKGLISYRYPLALGRYIMIGALSDQDALSEANRSLTFGDGQLYELEIWSPDENKYVKIESIKGGK
jgi:hypothetical protein